MQPKISVALCTYNGEKFIELQLESIFQQSLAVDEIIICDDGSTDKTIEIINAASKKYPGIIQLHINETNLRSVKNFEKAISLTTGDYIFLSDQDDLWHKDKVKKIIAAFNENPKVEGVFTDATLINDDSNEIGGYTLWQLAMFNYGMIEKFNGFWKIFQLNQNMVTGATFCFSKKAKEFIFPFPISTYFFHDEWIALHLASRGSLMALQEHLTFYRIHTSQQVGDIMLQRYEKEREYSDWVLGFKEPRNFGEYLKSYKRAYTIYLKFIDLKKNAGETSLDIDALIKGSAANFENIGEKMKKRYPISFPVKRAIDKIRNKRQLKPLQ